MCSPGGTLVLVHGKALRNKAAPEPALGLSAQQEGRVWCCRKFACNRVPNHHKKSPLWQHVTPWPQKTEMKMRQKMEPGLCFLHEDPFKYQTILRTPLLMGFWQEIAYLSKHSVCPASTHTQAFSALFFPKGRLFPGIRKGSINISNPNGNQGHGLMAQPKGREGRYRLK